MGYTTGNSILAKLPPMEGKEVVLVDNQDVNDIIKGVMSRHKMYVDHYDQIWEEFYYEDIEKICKALFNFCKNYVPYNVESDEYQTVRSPAAIIALAKIWGADCKHYASFIGGVLDSIKRNTGKPINWTYRFASYDFWNSTPEHVFVVVDVGKKKELWVDPVLQTFNQRDPNPQHIYDKRPKMALVSISGINNHIGDADNGNPSAATIILAALPIVGTLLSKLFGRKEPESSNVRWLTAYYRKQVVGEPGPVGDLNDNISPQLADQAQAWFSSVLGVPIYDILRYYALAGRAPEVIREYYDPKTKKYIYQSNAYPNGGAGLAAVQGWQLRRTISIADPIANTDAERIDYYKRIAGSDAAGVPDEEILQAVQIAKVMDPTFGQVGKWKDFPAAPSSINRELIEAYNAANPTKPIDSTNMPVITNNSISDIIKANPLATAGIAAVGVWGIYELTKPKKKMGKIDNNTILYVGLGAAALFLLTKKSSGSTTTQQPVYQPYPYYPNNSNNQANVWSFLDSLADLAAGIFVKKNSSPIYTDEP